MFEQIESHSEIADRIRESVDERGFGPTIIGGMLTIVMMSAVIAFTVLTSGVGATDPQGAVRVLQQAGYQHVTITGYRWYTCSKEDYFHTGFSAVGVNGEPVSGTVCKGLTFKGNTIRMD